MLHKIYSGIGETEEGLMAIHVENTGNDFERKFILSHKISAREKCYQEANEALHSPIAHKIFGFPWAESVTVGPDFVTVTRQDWVQWDVLQEPLAGLIQEHFANYSEASAVEENPQPPAEKKTDSLQSAEAQVIQQLFEEEVNPSLASHGGFVTLKAVEDSTVYLEMGGGCQGCAMSYMTLKEGIETAIKSRVPSIQNVVDVTDHNSGTNPYM